MKIYIDREKLRKFIEESGDEPDFMACSPEIYEEMKQSFEKALKENQDDKTSKS